jgi:hypothetical protein
VHRMRAREKSQYAELANAVGGRRPADLRSITNALLSTLGSGLVRGRKPGRQIRFISVPRISQQRCFASGQLHIRHFSRQVNSGAFSPISFMAEKLLNKILNGLMRGLTTCPCYRA